MKNQHSIRKTSDYSDLGWDYSTLIRECKNDLYENSLKSFKSEYVNLSRNKLTDLDGMHKIFPKVIHLDISHNHIELIHNESLPIQLSFFRCLKSLKCDLKKMSFVETQRLLNCININKLNGVDIMHGDHHKKYLESCNEILLKFYSRLKKMLKTEMKEKVDVGIVDEFEHYYHLLISRCDADFETYRKELHRDIILFGKYQINHEYYLCLLKVLVKDKEKNFERMKLVKQSINNNENIFKEFIGSSFFHAQERYNMHRRKYEYEPKVRLYVHTPSTFIVECEAKTKEHIKMIKQNMPRPVSTKSFLELAANQPHVGKRKKENMTTYQKIWLFFTTLFPFVSMFKGYNLSLLYKDMLSGVTVGIMSIPQAMAYSLIAGLPPVFGLYTGLFPKLMYPLFGTSKVASIGPSALQALLVAGTLEELQIHNQNDRILIATSLAVICGGVQFLLGTLRLGFIVNFLSYTVISGFTSASAICIGLSQLPNFFGIQSHSESHVAHKIIYDILSNFNQLFVNWPNLIFGTFCLIFLIFFQKVKIPIIKKERTISIFKKKIVLKPFTLELEKLPYYLLLVIVGLIIMQVFRITYPHLCDDHQVMGVKITGVIQGGFPIPSIPFLQTYHEIKPNWQLYLNLFLRSFAIILVGFIEHISVTKICAERSHPVYDINSSQELMALGSSCFIGGFFKAFPSAGCIGRTAVAQEVGAKTQVFSYFVFLVMLTTVSFLTFLFTNLPLSLLAAMIMVIVVHLIDIKVLIFCFKTKKTDFVLLLLAFFCTLFWGVVEGILVSALLSILLIIYKSSRPILERLGRIPGSTNYRNVDHFSEAIETPGILLLQFDHGIYFANISFFLDNINKQLREYEHDCHILILSFSSVNFIDTNGVIGLEKLYESMSKRHIELCFSHVKFNVYSIMFKAGLVNKIGRNLFFLEEEDALIYAEREIQNRFEKKKREIKEAKRKRNKSFDDIWFDKEVREKLKKGGFLKPTPLKKLKKTKSFNLYNRKKFFSTFDLQSFNEDKSDNKKSYFENKHKNTIFQFHRLDLDKKVKSIKKKRRKKDRVKGGHFDVMFDDHEKNHHHKKKKKHHHHHHKKKKKHHHHHKKKKKHTLTKPWGSFQDNVLIDGTPLSSSDSITEEGLSKSRSVSDLEKEESNERPRSISDIDTKVMTEIETEVETEAVTQSSAQSTTETETETENSTSMDETSTISMTEIETEVTTTDVSSQNESDTSTGVYTTSGGESFTEVSTEVLTESESDIDKRNDGSTTDELETETDEE